MPYAKSVECATSLPPHPPYRAPLFCLTSTRSATEVNAAPTHAHQRRSFETAITACVSPHALGIAINGDGASSQRRSLTLTVAVHVPSYACGAVTEGDGALRLYHMLAPTAATRVPTHVTEPGAIVRLVLGQDSFAALSGLDLAKDKGIYFAVELFAGFARFTQAPQSSWISVCCFRSTCLSF